MTKTDTVVDTSPEVTTKPKRARAAGPRVQKPINVIAEVLDANGNVVPGGSVRIVIATKDEKAFVLGVLANRSKDVVTFDIQL